MNKDKIIKEILLEYSFLSEDGGISFDGDVVDTDRLLTAIENRGYASYFSTKKLTEVLFTLGKQKFLDDNDIAIFRKFVGEKSKIDDKLLRRFDISQAAIPDDFPGAERDPTRIPHKEMEEILKSELKAGRKLKITIAPTKVKIYANGITISTFNIGTGIKLESKGFFAFLRLVDFYKHHMDEIEIGSASAEGIAAEKIQVDQLNTYFDKNNAQHTKFHLYVKDGSESIDSGVNVDSALHIGATGKADITLKNENTDVFWISFKAADYFNKAGSGLANKVGFRHYGSTILLGERLATDPKWKELITNLTAGVIKNLGSSNVLDLTDKIVDTDKKSGLITSINKVSILKVLKGDREKLRFLTSKSAAVEKLLLRNDVNKKLVYFTPKGFSVVMDFLDGSDASKEIAGKSIYGLDFKLDKSAPFGPENVNVLMQSSTPITISPFENPSGEPSILIQTNARGHVLYNPNLPLPKGTEDPILKYRPVFNPSFVENQIHMEIIDGIAHLFLGLRILIKPAGTVAGSSVNLSAQK